MTTLAEKIGYVRNTLMSVPENSVVDRHPLNGFAGVDAGFIVREYKNGTFDVVAPGLGLSPNFSTIYSCLEWALEQSR